MKKLQLNKQTIASLDNPDKIFGGEEKVTETYNGNTIPMTCANTLCATLHCVREAKKHEADW
ncbi:MAG: class I lanthipeptide [Bacteroidetes bacterium]|nr:class I lanthipeptide [Bacteroidota bacterium]MCL2302168.1 class I lanthipeptide [Lentimicrobiaceae bacterium]